MPSASCTSPGRPRRRSQGCATAICRSNATLTCRQRLFPACYGRELCGTDRHLYELYLDLNGIEHRRMQVKSPKTKGFVKRFNGIVLDAFFSVRLRENLYDSVEALQVDLDAWVVLGRTERPHLGSLDTGRRAAETVMSFVGQKGQVDTQPSMAAMVRTVRRLRPVDGAPRIRSRRSPRRERPNPAGAWSQAVRSTSASCSSAARSRL